MSLAADLQCQDPPALTGPEVDLKTFQIESFRPEVDVNPFKLNVFEPKADLKYFTLKALLN